MCANGNAIDPTSSGPMSRASASPAAPAISVSSVWRTPFGFAVVPDV
jgi:hypothetical protein